MSSARTGRPSASGSRCTLVLSPPRARAPGLLRFFRAPAACWWARTVVESSSSVPKPASQACTAANNRPQAPLLAQRATRVYVVCSCPRPAAAPANELHYAPASAPLRRSSDYPAQLGLDAPVRAAPARTIGLRSIHPTFPAPYNNCSHALSLVLVGGMA